MTIAGTNSAELKLSGSNYGVTDTDGADVLFSYGGLYLINNESTGNIHFHTGSGVPERLRITSAGNVGISSATPSSPLEIHTNASAAWKFRINTSVSDGAGFYQRANGDFEIVLRDASNNNNYIAGTSGALQFATSGSERFRITSTGYLKIPDNAHIHLGGAQTGAGDLQIYHDTSANFNNIQSTPGNNLRIRQQSNGASLYLAATHVYLQNHSNNQTYLHAQNGGSVTLNYSGNARARTDANGFYISRVNTFSNPNNTGSETLGAMIDIGGNIHLQEVHPTGAYTDRCDLVLNTNSGYGLGLSDKLRITAGGQVIVGGNVGHNESSALLSVHTDASTGANMLSDSSAVYNLSLIHI